VREKGTKEGGQEALPAFILRAEKKQDKLSSLSVSH